MGARKTSKASLVERTPLAEWLAAGLGLLLTLTVIGYLLVDGLEARGSPPKLSVRAEPAQRMNGGYVVPISIHNASHATAAGVIVRGTLERRGEIVEERRATFDYVPGEGRVEGGLIFQQDPSQLVLRVVAEGYEEP
jgi:uncharacterized protein (TIGR02588 family)